ncbi:hypothetical protein PR048_020558 [Dryococelus australis]|uniref:PiggyBac transposable element-derived protein domain-containing protein n=1 Tax=Dryococelus australis TaxID=614101 RepID=A0ABQ9H6N1_9NEOP|nr:hypothetical protein PR048_020558 [Dryococelus australis]
MCYQNNAVNEQLLGFHGRCVFKMFIPSKPDMYGIKILIIHFICENSSLHWQGFNSQRNSCCTAPTGIALLIIGSLHTLGKKKKLLREHTVTMVGAMRSNKAEIPPLFKDIRGHKQNSAMFAFSGKETLLSYCPPKKKQIVTILTTIIEFYNATKGGVDCFDNCVIYTQVSRKTRQWPLCIFHGLLNAVGINCTVLLAGSKSKSKDKESVPN